MFLKAVDDGGVHVVECLHVFSRDGSERSLFVTIQLFHNAGHENVARRQTKNRVRRLSVSQRSRRMNPARSS